MKNQRPGAHLEEDCPPAPVLKGRRGGAVTQDTKNGPAAPPEGSGQHGERDLSEEGEAMARKLRSDIPGTTQTARTDTRTRPNGSKTPSQKQPTDRAASQRLRGGRLPLRPIQTSLIKLSNRRRVCRGGRVCCCTVPQGTPKKWQSLILGGAWSTAAPTAKAKDRHLRVRKG